MPIPDPLPATVPAVVPSARKGGAAAPHPTIWLSVPQDMQCPFGGVTAVCCEIPYIDTAWCVCMGLCRIERRTLRASYHGCDHATGKNRDRCRFWGELQAVELRGGDYQTGGTTGTTMVPAMSGRQCNGMCLQGSAGGEA
eukprot:gene6722-biopygen23920